MMSKATQDAYYLVLARCAHRYLDMVDTHSNIYEFILEFLEQIKDEAPLMKMNRWLGYIQGVVISEQLTTVARERDWTRPLFKPLDMMS